MAFQTTSFRETQAELEWDVFWDGWTGSVLREDRSFWVTSAEVVFGPPDANGARAVLGLDVTAHHKQGPHLDATNTAPSVSLRMDPPQILSEAATSDIARGRQTARHATARGAHKDSFDLFTARLVGQSGVTIKLRTAHDVPALPPTGGGTDTAVGGTGKSFTFDEKTDHDTGYDWWSGALNFGEVDVASVDAMVDHIIENLGDDECIEEITIIGNGDKGAKAGKEIAIGNPGEWHEHLLRLRGKFCEDSTAYLRGCNVGADDAGAELLHMLNEVFQCAGKIQAPTGLCYPTHTTGDDQTVERGDTAPPTAIPNPDIPNSLRNPKVLMGYDPEIIGDGISPFCPLLWQSSAEEIEDSVDEVPEVGMEPVVGHFAVHDSP